VQIILLIVFQGLILFLSAGSTNWPLAWAYLGLLAGVLLFLGGYLHRHNPALLAERAEFAPRQGVERWDVILSSVARVSLLGILVVCGLDRRFGWTAPLSLGLQITALAFGLCGGALILWALACNRNAAVYARLQVERGHTVASGGPYRYVRHPFYAGVLVYAASLPPALGSLWALLLSLLVTALFIVKTAKEDQLLCAELDGYQAYAEQVRYRLLPGVW
jgi:protein-S-isoprenylcysteine O-methyltransferase Ste14